MRFTDLLEWVRENLGPKYADLMISPGPEIPNHPEMCLVITPVGGAGLNTEDLFDDSGYQFLSIGDQGDLGSAEDLALAVDKIMISTHSGRIAGAWVTKIRRSTSPPSLLRVDDAERTHFVCNYAFDVQSILTREV